MIVIPGNSVGLHHPRTIWVFIETADLEGMARHLYSSSWIARRLNAFGAWSRALLRALVGYCILLGKN
jgi:hypothetical protein